MTCTDTTLSSYVGDDLILTVTITDSDWTALNITGYTVYFTVKELDDEAANDNNAVLQQTITSHLAPTAGQTLVSISHTLTDDVPAGLYKYDIKAKNTLNQIFTVISWNINFSKDVTKRA